MALALITQSYFAVPKNVRLFNTRLRYENSKQNFQREFQQIAFNCLSDIDFQNFKNHYKKGTPKLYSLLVIDTTLASYNSLRFRKNPLEKI